MIDALAVVADSVVIVVHGEWNAEAGRFADSALDVYVGKRILARELEVGGDVVAYSPNSVLVLKPADRNAAGSTLVEYQWRSPTD